tara:strand:- start:16 stop:1146 length:1131 start_codon:yes stop_codon:yes gene_type:complete
MKIVCIIDIKPDSGGGLGMCLTKINYIKKLKQKKILILTTYKSTSEYLKKKYKIDNFFYNKNLPIFRFINYLSKKIPIIQSHFERFLINNNVDKVFFLSPSYLNILIKKLNFVYTVWDLSHLEKKLESLPEHDIKVRNSRDNSYKYSAEKAKFIIIGTKENRDKFINNYKCTEEVVYVKKFPPYISLIKNENVETPSVPENYLLYPAQYWEHKNHKYLIKFFEDFRLDLDSKNISLVCTGYDKGILKNLLSVIKKKNLQDRIFLLNYVSDQELKFLYQNSFGIVFPSLIGSHSFPLYEAFYFEKPVFYNKEILSKELLKYVYPIDVNFTQSFYNQLIKIYDENETKKLTDKAKNKFNEIFDEKKIIQNLESMIKKI